MNLLTRILNGSFTVEYSFYCRSSHEYSFFCKESKLWFCAFAVDHCLSLTFQLPLANIKSTFKADFFNLKTRQLADGHLNITHLHDPATMKCTNVYALKIMNTQFGLSKCLSECDCRQTMVKNIVRVLTIVVSASHHVSGAF